MRIIELENEYPMLDNMLDIATQETVIFRKPGGAMYVLSQIDESDAEVELLKNNKELMEFLKKLSQEEPVISLDDLKNELSL